MLSYRSKATRNSKALCLFICLSLCRGLETAPFTGCDHVYNVNPGLSNLESPGYPMNYPPNTSCRYKFNAPLDHSITVECTINLDKGVNGCSTEFFYLARDGDTQLRGSEQFCGSGTFTRKSLFQSVTVAYTSGGGSGRFKCSLRVEYQSCDCGWSVNTKIVNGKETDINEYPSMAALRDRTSNLALFCAATIISSRYVLTAGHCIHVQPDPTKIEILVGRHNLQANLDTQYSAVYYASQLFLHPGYTSQPTNNDIALIRTSTNIQFQKGVGPACLPPMSNINNDFSYNYVDVIGWGAIGFTSGNSPTLQKVTLMVVENTACRNAFQGQATIYPSQICTYDSSGTSKDSCQYDSGGPVYFRHKNRQFVIGVISFGKHCGAGGYATGVNTRVTSYLQWIHSFTQSTTCPVEM